MVIKNKKGNMLESMLYFTIIPLILISSIIVFYFFFVVGNNNVAVPLVDAGLNSFNDTVIVNGLNDAGDFYHDFNLSFIDYGCLLSLVMVTAISLIISYFSRNLNYFTFLSLLTYGLMFVLFILGIVEIYTDFFYDTLINLFPTLIIHLPIFNWFLTNVGVYCLVLFCIMLLINQLDFDLAIINNRKKKENDLLNQDEIV